MNLFESELSYFKPRKLRKNLARIFLMLSLLSQSLIAAQARASTVDQRARAALTMYEILSVEGLGLTVPADGKTYPDTSDPIAKNLVDILKNGGCVSVKNQKPDAHWNYEVTGPNCSLRVTSKTSTLKDPRMQMSKTENTSISFFSTGDDFMKASQVLSINLNRHFEQSLDSNLIGILNQTEVSTHVVSFADGTEINLKVETQGWESQSSQPSQSLRLHREKNVSLSFYEFTIQGSITENKGPVGGSNLTYVLDGKQVSEREFLDVFLTNQLP